MSDCTVIPAAPGTSLMECSIDHEDGSKPYFRRRMVVGWRVSNSARLGLEAIVVGGANVTIDEGIGEVMDNGDFSSITIVRDGEGWGTFGDEMDLGSQLREKMVAALLNSRDKHLAGAQRRERSGNE